MRVMCSVYMRTFPVQTLMHYDVWLAGTEEVTMSLAIALKIQGPVLLDVVVRHGSSA